MKEDKLTFQLIEANPQKKYKLKESIQFNNLSFSYCGRDNYILKDTNFTIKKGQKIGIIGETGGGKSTLINLLMGLLEPLQEKYLLIKKLGIRRLSIYAFLESIYLSRTSKYFSSDITISENIAFGLDINKIEMDRVISAAKKANTQFY